MLSIICAYNDEKILKEKLEKSLQDQKNAFYEYVPINTCKNGFISAAQALNYAGEKAKGEYLVFLHQDIVMEDVYCLEKIQNWCKENEFGIAGVAGCVNENGKSVTYSNIYHGEMHERVTTKQISESRKVESLDECLLVIPKKIFLRYNFSNLGKTWHLYGTDYSLKMKINGYSSYVLPIEIWHLSKGTSMNMNYYKTVYKVARTYKKYTSMITTIFGIWPTNMILLVMKCTYRGLRFRIRGK